VIFICCVDCNVIEVPLMPQYIFTNIEYANMLYIYDFRDNSVIAAALRYTAESLSYTQNSGCIDISRRIFVNINFLKCIT